MLQFFDETGNNPMPAGITVSIYHASEKVRPRNIVVQKVSTAGGFVSATLTPSGQYVALFSMAGEAPNVPVEFTVDADATQTTAISISGYRSPTLSTNGYVQIHTGLLPDGLFTAADLQSGGGAYGASLMASAMFGSLDAVSQLIQETLRLQSCVGAEIDSWAFDFLGPYLLRYPNEPDAAYMGRIIAALSTPKCTLAAIKNMVTAFYQAIQYQLVPNSRPNLAFDEAGGLDSRGAFDKLYSVTPGAPIIPTINVFDHQSNPVLADEYDIHEPQFCISLGDPPAKRTELAFDSQGSFDGSGSFDASPGFVRSETAPDPRLGALVDFVKSEGTWPIYLIFANNSDTHVPA